MQNTEHKSSSHGEIQKLPETRSTASAGSSTTSVQANENQKNLSRNIAEHLLHLMKEVTKEKVNPRTVNAARQCASELHKVMKLNMELKKMAGGS